MSLEDVRMSGAGFLRSVACTIGAGLLVGPLVYGLLASRLDSSELAGIGFLCGFGAAAVTWGLTAGWITRSGEPRRHREPGPRERGFEVIQDAKEAPHDR